MIHQPWPLSRSLHPIRQFAQVYARIGRPYGAIDLADNAEQVGEPISETLFLAQWTC